MSTSSNPNQSETSESIVVPKTTPTCELSDRPLLLKVNDETGPMITHLDENNENEAVRDLSFLLLI